MDSLSHETVKELESLYAAYCLLDDKNREGQVDYSHGMHAISNRLYEILQSEAIHQIVLRACHNSFDDYPRHVKEDTPEYIEAIKAQLM